MAGTPTQYYGLPTYADSDAVDLTAQYNQAMAVIDSAMHAADIRIGEKTVIIMGDSFTVKGTDGGLTDAFENHGWTVFNYGVSGSGFFSTLSNTAQFDQVLADHAGQHIDMLVMVNGQNDYSRDGFTGTEYAKRIRTQFDRLHSRINIGKYCFIPNCGRVEKSIKGVANIPPLELPQYLTLVRQPMIACAINPDANFLPDGHPNPSGYFGEYCYLACTGAFTMNATIAKTGVNVGVALINGTPHLFSLSSPFTYTMTYSYQDIALAYVIPNYNQQTPIAGGKLSFNFEDLSFTVSDTTIPSLYCILDIPR